jgi:hypothetical protein
MDDQKDKLLRVITDVSASREARAEARLLLNVLHPEILCEGLFSKDMQTAPLANVVNVAFAGKGRGAA